MVVRIIGNSISKQIVFKNRLISLGDNREIERLQLKKGQQAQVCGITNTSK
ncbi:unnamed protein product [Paramecium sonneborni]|uniref:Uncharacterized protein n=1 Tax=Paramecium sonneborni TaxID=65129 RepID=A0A8S1LRY5_9CILI|nr:unnamed protein product [Paramecium sonneborni]